MDISKRLNRLRFAIKTTDEPTRHHRAKFYRECLVYSKYLGGATRTVKILVMAMTYGIFGDDQ